MQNILHWFFERLNQNVLTEPKRFIVEKRIGWGRLALNKDELQELISELQQIADRMEG